MRKEQIVRLISITEPTKEFTEQTSATNAEDIIAYCARVSNPANQENFNTAAKLINYLMEHAHYSPFEMVSVVFEIETTRDIGRQILRHRSAHFQEFCISGDSLITTAIKSGATKKISIENLYRRQQSKQYSDMSDWLVKIYDRSSKNFTTAKIKEVFETGIKPVYRISTEGGKRLTATKEHKLLTFNGFKQLGEITTEDFLACNGIPIHQDKEWLDNAKKFSLETGSGLKGIAELANCKPVTITKWLRRYGIQFTRKEVSSYTSIWNKGLDTTQQPMYGKYHKQEVRQKMRESAKKASDSNLFVNGNKSYNTVSWRLRVAQWCKGFHTELLQKQNYRCAISGEEIDLNSSEIDHKIPVFRRPDLAFEPTNLQVLSIETHAKKTETERLESKKTVRYQKVKSIEFVGERQTYDMEIDHFEHSYIANGIVTHNSQRYASPNPDDFYIRECRFQDKKNRQNSVERTWDTASYDERHAMDWFEAAQDLHIKASIDRYQKALDMGIAKEQARCFLPEGNTPSVMYMAMTLRDWIFYCQLRMGKETQKEHRLIAEMIWNILKEQFKFLAEYDNKKNKSALDPEFCPSHPPFGGVSTSQIIIKPREKLSWLQRINNHLKQRW